MAHAKSSPTDPHRDRRAKRLALVLASPMLAFTLTAQAYIDPGTGSLILQGLIAAVAGIAVAIGVFWERVKAFFRRSPGDPGRGENPDARADGSANPNRTHGDA